PLPVGRPWSRWLWKRPAAPAFARERAPTWIAFPPDRTSPGSLWERPWSRWLWGRPAAPAFARERAPTWIASLRPIRHRPLPVGATLDGFGNVPRRRRSRASALPR